MQSNRLYRPCILSMSANLKVLKWHFKLISAILNIQFTISPSQALLRLPSENSQVTSKQRDVINHIILIAKLSIVESNVS